MAKATLLFLERAMVFLAGVKCGRAPNAPWLAERCEISLPTAHRVIQGLMDRFGAPLEYSAADRGYLLTDADWVFPFELCSMDELGALLLSTALLRELGDEEVSRAGHLLWRRVAERTGSTTERLLRLAEGFSADRTDRLCPAEPMLMLLLDAIDRRRAVQLDYGSPWTGEPPRRRDLIPLHLRSSDGSLYLRAVEGDEVKVFNLAFAADLSIGDVQRDEMVERGGWSDSFGVWQGEDVVEVEVRIAPPGSRYFARQSWVDGQKDSWDGEVLVRRFAAHPSPQLLRRLLSVAPWLESVEPVELRQLVVELAKDLVQRMEDTDD